MLIRSLLALLLIAVIVHELESAPAPNKNYPFKPIYRILKELRKVQKYKYKYGGGGRERDNDSDESSEEWNGGGGSWSGNRPTGNRPSLFPSGNRPSIFPGSGGNKENGGGSGGGQRQPSTGFPGGAGNGGDAGNGGGAGGGDPLQQLNQGFSSLLQGLGSLSLGQLVGGGFNFPSN